MRKTVKFAVSMPEENFRELESLRKKTGRSRSQFIRELLAAWQTNTSSQIGVREETALYRKDLVKDIADQDEIRKRASDAAGRFRSGLTELSQNHDRYLEDSYNQTAGEKHTKKGKSAP